MSYQPQIQTFLFLSKKNMCKNKDITLDGTCVHPFVLQDVGGGFLAIAKSSQDVHKSLGFIRFGVIGELYSCSADAEADARRLALLKYSNSNSASVSFGGCAAVLYATNRNPFKKGQGSPFCHLLDRFAELFRKVLVSVKFLPDGHTTSQAHISYLDDVLRSTNSEFEDFLVPKPFLGTADFVSEYKAGLAFGCIVALAEAKGWNRGKIAIHGLVGTGSILMSRLHEAGWTVIGYDPDESVMWLNATDRIRYSEKLLEEDCDILIICSLDVILKPTVIPELGCNSILDTSEGHILGKMESECQDLLAERGIKHYDDVTLNARGADVLERALNGQPIRFSDAVKLGTGKMKLHLHERTVIKKYETDEKRQFYCEVMGDDTDNIHFGIWDGIDVEEESALGKASANMTKWMWREAMRVGPPRLSTQTSKDKQSIQYIDLGSGTGSASRLITELYTGVTSTCLNLCPNQNEENRRIVESLGLKSCIEVVDGTYEQMPENWTSRFDGCFSQDAFMHAFSKKQALLEAYRVTKGGGWLVFSDMHSGIGFNLSEEERRSFAETNLVVDKRTSEEVVNIANNVGWVKVRFVDLSSHMRISFILMLGKIEKMISSGKHHGIEQLLMTYKRIFNERISQVDNGVFNWGVITARKPYEVFFTRAPPVTPKLDEMCKFVVSSEEMKGISPTADVLAVSSADHMNAQAIDQLPSSVRVLVSLSVGLDHVDQITARSQGITVLRAGRKATTNAVADYLLGIIILTLRDMFSKINTPMPASGRNLSSEDHGIDLHTSVIGIVGKDQTAMALVERIRGLTKSARVLYTCPLSSRDKNLENRLNLEYVSLNSLLEISDVVSLLCSLNPKTNSLIGADEIALMKASAVLINVSGGYLCDTEALTRVMQDGGIRHAFLDCTDPDTLPRDHPLWNMKNVTITPQLATNTPHVREQMVDDVAKVTLRELETGEGDLEEEEAKLRHDLSVAHMITHKMGMDELVWNHISGRLSNGVMLITPGRMMYDEIGPEDLTMNPDNVTGDIIHSAIYEERPDVRSVVHLHTIASQAVSCLADGFQAYTQDAAYVYGRVASYDWKGFSFDEDEKCEIRAAVAAVPGCNTVLMRHHGFCSFGKSVAEAWTTAFWFERACQTQLQLLQTGQKILMPDREVMERTATDCSLSPNVAGECEWAALERMVERLRCKK